MIRMFDYECPNHGLFEGMVTTDTIPEFSECPFPTCGAMAKRVWRSSPSMNPSGVHAIEVGGRTYRRDDMEEFLTTPAQKQPSFYEQPQFRERFHEALSRAAKKEINGELAPLTAEVPKEHEAQLANATANVDAEVASANQNQFLDTFRKTEFKE